jgi:hypothetical protein
MSNSYYHLLQAQARHEELMRIAENERLAKSLQSDNPSIWSRVRALTTMPQSEVMEYRTEVVKAAK